jgi:hypothetical protein
MASVACSACGAENRPGRRFCGADRGQIDAAESAFREAASLLRHFEAPFMLGRCLHQLAALLVRHDRGDEAAELLREADGLFGRVAATAWLERNAALTPTDAAA